MFFVCLRGNVLRISVLFKLMVKLDPNSGRDHTCNELN